MGLSTTLLPALLLCLAMGLIAWHLQSWRAAKRQQLDELQRDFSYRQFRRRVQTSCMLGLLAVGLWGGQWISPEQTPLLYLGYWAGVLFLTIWMALLALADMAVSRVHVGRLERKQRGEHARLQAELRHIRAEEENGQPPVKKDT